MYSVSKANKLLPTIIDKNKHFQKQIKNKMRVANIFQELDHKASKELMNLIQLSEKRNRNIKTGSLLQTVLQKNSEKSNQLSSKIMNDPVFGNVQFLKDERKKLKKVVAKQYEEEFANLIKQMESTGKVEYSVQSKINEKQIKQDQLSTFQRLSQEEKIKRNNEIINEKFLQEQQALNNNIQEYLKNMNNLYKNYSSEKDNVGNKEEQEEINQKFIHDKKKLPGLTVHHKSDLLHYRKYIPPDLNINKSNSQKDIFNIKKLLPYTRTGKAAMKTKSQIAFSRNNENKEINLDAIIQAKQSTNFTNTANLVLTQALKNYSLDEEFLSKAHSFNELIEFNLPSLEEYNKIVKNKLTAMKLNRGSNMSSDSTEREEEIRKSKKKKTTVKYSEIDEEEDDDEDAAFNKLKLEKIRESIRALIEGARRGAEVDTIEKPKKMITPKEENNLISGVNTRAKNKYCDGYSIREGSCNEMIDKLVEVFGKKTYSKKQISDSIEMYFDLVNTHRKKQNEKLYKKYLNKINSEEKVIISDKIKRNLSAENVHKKEEHEIDLIKNMNKKERNIKVNFSISSTSNNNNEILDNSSLCYEEFLEQKKLVEKREKSSK